MKFSRSGLLSSLGLLAAVAPVAAQVRFTQQDSNLSYVLYTTTSGQNTDLHFNLSIPASHGWGAVGVGSQMIGALMFILLPDSTNGSTISVRSTAGYIMPTPLSGVDFEVVKGSADNGILHAEAICRSCQQWGSSGSLDPTSSSQPFVWAVGPGTSGVSGSGQNANIQRHSIMGNFNADLASAAMNPGSSSGGSGSSGSGGSGGGSGSGSSGASANSGITGGGTIKAPKKNLVTAHAALLGLAFLFFYPVGVILLRAPGFGSWKLHAGAQLIGFILTIAGLGIAVSMCMGTVFGKYDKGHQGVGLTATSLAIVQFLLGVVHHMGYSKFQKRWAVTWLHIVIGPIAMILGGLNPILGFKLTMMRSAQIGVGVVGLFIVLSSLIFAWVVGGMTRKSATVTEKRTDS